ncbi:hypothetical protein [Streptomyces megasporus]|uniref:hypothetical protein n=1 Tax=Streptomyces megasporus TaxID=44060 RepID=UPI00068E4471|nr:hypothetical protein [Streptomyces megasporus]
MADLKEQIDMHDLIHRCLAWLGALLVPPGNGRHRARPPRPVPVRTVRPSLLVTALAMPLPTTRRWRRSDGPADGERSPLVRPCLIAYEQYERRRALALALDGIDVGPSVIHGVRVGAAR